MPPRHNAAARALISKRMKEYWAGRRAAKQQAQPVKAEPAKSARNGHGGFRLKRDAQNRYAVLGARVRLEQIAAEQKEIERLLKRLA